MMLAKLHSNLKYLAPHGLHKIVAMWKHWLKKPPFRNVLWVCLPLLLLVLFSLPGFFEFIEERKGIRLNDFLLQNITPLNLSLPVFAIIYLVVLFSIYHILITPVSSLILIVGYTALLSIRMITLYLVALEPDPLLIPLQDPIIDRFIYPDTFITKDLFFSGHVSTLFLFYLAVPHRWLKWLILLATLTVSIMLLVQHVHYTIDIVAAPCFSLLCYQIAKRVVFHKKIPE